MDEPAGPGPSSVAAAGKAPGSAKKRKRALVFADMASQGQPLEQEIIDAPRRALLKVEGACPPAPPELGASSSVERRQLRYSSG